MGRDQPDDALGLRCQDLLARVLAAVSGPIDPECPSGLSITSSTVGSARAAAMVGPKAVRNICRRWHLASLAAPIVCARRSKWNRSVIAVLLLWRVLVGLGGWLRRYCRGWLEGRIDACRRQKIRMLRDDDFEHFEDKPLASGELPANLSRRRPGTAPFPTAEPIPDRRLAAAV